MQEREQGFVSSCFSNLITNNETRNKVFLPFSLFPLGVKVQDCMDAVLLTTPDDPEQIEKEAEEHAENKGNDSRLNKLVLTSLRSHASIIRRQRRKAPRRGDILQRFRVVLLSDRGAW